MDGISNVKSNDAILDPTRSNEPSGYGEASAPAHGQEGDEERHVTSSKRRPWARKSKSYSHAHFKVYKRRWFGLGQLVLLNIVVSWDVSTTTILPDVFTRPLQQRHQQANSPTSG
jgi:FLVCR family MFS transporter 7